MFIANLTQLEIVTLLCEFLNCFLFVCSTGKEERKGNKVEIIILEKKTQFMTLS